MTNKKSTTSGNGNGNGDLSNDMIEEIDAQLGMLCQVGMERFLEKVVKLKSSFKLRAIEYLAKDIDKKKLYNAALRRRISL